MSEKSSPSAQIVVSVKATGEDGRPVLVEFFVHDGESAKSLAVSIGYNVDCIRVTEDRIRVTEE